MTQPSCCYFSNVIPDLISVFWRYVDWLCCCCFPCHQSVRCVWIIRWWCYNLRQVHIRNYYPLLFITYLCLLLPLHHFCPPPDIRLGGLPAPAPSLSSLSTVLSPHIIICPSGRHLSMSKNNKVIFSLNQILLPPLLPCPRHNFQVTIAAQLPPTKYLLTSHSAASKPLFAVTTAHGASLLPLIPSPYRKPQV